MRQIAAAEMVVEQVELVWGKSCCNVFAITTNSMHYLVATKKAMGTIALERCGQLHPLLHSQIIYNRQ